MTQTITAPSRFQNFITIKLGTQNSAKDLLTALKTNGFLISAWAAQILKKIPLAETETEIDLVLVTVADLGFKRSASRDAIYNRAKDLGLDLCPAEAGPQLRLQYPKQPLGEWILIAMEPITGSVGALGVFLVGRRDDGQWLDTIYGDPDYEWSPGNRWVFARRKQN